MTSHSSPCTFPVTLRSGRSPPLKWMSSKGRQLELLLVVWAWCQIMPPFPSHYLFHCYQSFLVWALSVFFPDVLFLAQATHRCYDQNFLLSEVLTEVPPYSKGFLVSNGTEPLAQESHFSLNSFRELPRVHNHIPCFRVPEKTQTVCLGQMCSHSPLLKYLCVPKLQVIHQC